MYAKAIQWGLDHGFKMRSSGNPSVYAQQVWNGSSLRRFFSIRKNPDYVYGPKFTVLKQKKNK